jgi:MFS transporter, DHA3 family, macrolide efflux protein
VNPSGVLKNRNFARLFFAGAASIAGFSIGQVAINYFVYTSTHSSVDLAVTGVAFTVALVSLSLFGGTLADRQDRRVLMIVCDGVRAVSLALVAVALIFFGFNLWLVLAASFILGAFSAVFQPAERALIPSILEKEQLADANGLIQLTSSLAQALSNALGGALVVAVGAILAIGLNSVTFLVSGLLIATLATRRAPPGGVETAAKPRAGFMDDTREGVRYLAANRPLLLLTVSAGVFNLFFGMIFPFFVIYTAELLNGGATTYGIFLALFSLGAAPGSLMVARIGAVRRAGLAWTVAGVVGGILLLVLILVPVTLVAFAAIFVFGVATGFAVTTWLSMVQIIVPNEMQGRYFGIDQLVSFAVIPVGQIVDGLTIAAFGLSWSYGIAGGGILLSSLAFWGFADLRRLGYSKP